MDGVPTSTELASLSSALLLLILNTHQALDVPHSVDEFEERDEIFDPLCLAPPTLTFDPQLVYNAALHSFRFCSLLPFFDDEVGFWVKPRSTTWFSRFLMDQFDDERWIQMFRMSKAAVHALAELLRPLIQKQNTKYRLAVPVLIRVACSLFKLAQGASLLICSELFAVGRSIVSLMLREVVQATNICLRSKISWPTGDSLRECQSSFQRLCGLPGVVGAIDGTHVSISKPIIGPTDYYYFKTGGYSINCQAVVSSDKKFLDLFIGMPGSTNDSRMLRRSFV